MDMIVEKVQNYFLKLIDSSCQLILFRILSKHCPLPGHGVAADQEACVPPELVGQAGDVLLLGGSRQEPPLRPLHLRMVVAELLGSEELEHDSGPGGGGHLGGPAPDQAEHEHDLISWKRHSLPLLRNDGKHLSPRPP